METKNTLKGLSNAHASALQLCDALETISKQFSHPTLQLERRTTSQHHRAFARGCYLGIIDINDMHTDDAANMVRHLQWQADKLENLGYDERLNEHIEKAIEHLGKANGIRYAAQLLAEENHISLRDLREQNGEPLLEGGAE